MDAKKIRDIKSRKTANDKIYTPPEVAQLMINMCEIKEGQSVLDPSKGGGVFYDCFPNYCIKDYCEIDENKDFFNYNNNVDIIIGNPPYSLITKWLDHTLKICNKFCYILGAMNFTVSRLRKISNAGFGLTKIHLVKVNWWFCTSFIGVFEKNKDSIITISAFEILCEYCNNRKCKRGRQGNPPNICTIIPFNQSLLSSP